MNESTDPIENIPPKSVLIFTPQTGEQDEIAKFCARLGLLTRIARSGAEAENHINFELPDLLILDAGMVACDGTNFLEHLDLRCVHWHMPVIIVHDIFDRESIQQPLRLPAYHVRRSVNLLPTLAVFAGELVAFSFNSRPVNQLPNRDE